MGTYLTFAALNSTTKAYEQQYRLNETRQYEFSSYAKIPVFLSHKHDEPQELIKKVKGFFAEQGASLYIDWLDKDMPQITNAETAEKLKDKIKQTEKFIILATPNSIQSVWIPWEIGLADQIKGLENITILPVVNDENNWARREYYQLYSRITKIDGKWLVVKPEYYCTGTELSRWLRS